MYFGNQGMFNVYWENWEGNGSFGQGDYMKTNMRNKWIKFGIKLII